MARSRPLRPRRLRPAQQSAMILARWPGFRLIGRGERYTWKGALQPTPLSPVYTIRIVYADWDTPKIFVLDPPLEPRGNTPIPHRYDDGSLCLNLPGEWSNQQYIADTIIHWAVLWLYHYEVWRVIGEWLGGGVHPMDPPIAESTHEHENISDPIH